jgi:prepilin-type N-terminal cleavage/methylation domain-containing protein
MNRGSLGRAGFTLVEILIVVGVMALLASMMVFLPKATQRDSAVKAAAEELAATMRQARAYAMAQRAVCAVAFNIQNGPGTSGKVLNNYSGGHWYRIIGPSFDPRRTNGLGVFPVPDFWGWDGSTVAQFDDDVRHSWLGDRHVLPRRQVRFLALGDQDNGTNVNCNDGGGWGTFPATYPRPWFGWYDPAAQRLYPWGGYDTAITDNAGRKCSGFYFEGSDGTISLCNNPATRTTTTAGTNTTIFQAGAGRPVINADWLDYVIGFNPDGTAVEGDIMHARYNSFWRQGAGGGNAPTGDLGDLTPLPGNPSDGNQRPITSYFRHTGWWSVTLCPDADIDTDRFPSADQALASIWPAYRVMVNQFGTVQVVRVSNLVPPGTTFDTSITNWQSTAQTNPLYKNSIATTAGGALRGAPVTSFLNSQILASREWWMVSP